MTRRPSQTSRRQEHAHPGWPVVSDKRAKTITVLSSAVPSTSCTARSWPSRSKYHAHDENGEYKMGDVVEIAESRPISKTKSWVVTRLVEKARAV